MAIESLWKHVYIRQVGLHILLSNKEKQLFVIQPKGDTSLFVLWISPTLWVIFSKF